MDDHFGHCAAYEIFEIDDNRRIVSTDSLPAPGGCGCKSGIAMVLRNMGVSVMLAGNMGQGAVGKLAENGIEVIRGCHGETGEVVEGKWKPSSDTKTHLELYKAFPGIGGIVHTHSPYAVAWAQAGEDIPCFGTTHADYFYGSIPCVRHLTQGELEEDYEKNTGKIVVETFRERCIEPTAVPAVICASHGPFTWGKDAAQAVYHAVVLEEVAKMAILTRQVRAAAGPAPQRYQDKHYFRKHGPGAYYGQN